MEIWKDIEEFDGEYQISNLGRIKRIGKTLSFESKNQYGTFIVKHNLKDKILKTTINSAGYYQVSLRKYGIKKNRLVHRLIAQAFIPNPENKPTVNHIDGDKTNNSLDNLEYATMKEQQWHSEHILNHKRIISEKCRKRQIELHQRKVIREDGVIFNSIKEASNGNETYRKEICKVCRGKAKTAGGYKWQYAD